MAKRKRGRMASGIRKKVPRPTVCTPGDSEFRAMVTWPAFMDKTMLLFTFLSDVSIVDGKRFAVISAPPRFGKTANLTMFRGFFEIEVDVQGRLKTSSNILTEAATDTDNFLLFCDPSKDRCLNIMQHKKLVEDHFGRHPVLYVDFKCNRSVATKEDAKKFGQDVAATAYQQHEYLCKSDNLTLYEREYCESWCVPEIPENMDPTNALTILCKYLYKHFGRDVVLLADEYDSAVSQAFKKARDDDTFEEICDILVHMLAGILKTQDKNIHLLGAVVTGVSYIAGIGWSGLVNNQHVYKFSQGHVYQEYCGLQKNEIVQVLPKLKKLLGFTLPNNAMNIMMTHYNGYEFFDDGRALENRKVLCPFSVMHYLQNGKTGSYWKKSSYIELLQNMFKNEEVNDFLLPLLDGQEQSKELHLLGDLSLTHLKDLRNEVKGAATDENATLFLNFIFELGFLTVDSMQVHHERSAYVQIPNIEVKLLFLDKLREHYGQKCTRAFKRKAAKKCLSLLKMLPRLQCLLKISGLP